MASYNRVIVAGNLTRDPELKRTQKGTGVCNFTIATNRKWKDPDGNTKEETTFVDVDAWGRGAETIAQYLKKGGGILVEGRLSMNEWTDKKSGEKRSKIIVTMEQFTFIGGKPEGGDRPRTSTPATTDRQRRAGVTNDDPGSTPPSDDPDADIPF